MIGWIVLSLLFAAEVAAIAVAARSLPRTGPHAWLVRDKWFGYDKLEHGTWSFGAAVALAAVGFGLPQGVLAFSDLALGVEAVEVLRLAWWVDDGAPDPWPALTHGLSLRDMAWNYAGGALGLGAVLLIRAQAGA